GSLIVTARCGCHRVAIATTWAITDVKLRLKFGFQCRVQRMLDQSMMVGAEFPFLYVRTEATIEIRNCFVEAPGEQVVSSGDWVRTKPAIRRQQPINNSLQTQVPDKCLRVLRHQQLTHICLNASLPHFVNARGYGVFV